MGFEFRSLGVVFIIAGFGFRVSGLGLRVQGVELTPFHRLHLASGFTEDVISRVSGFGFRVRVSGFGSWVLDVGRRVRDLGLRS